MIGGRARHLSSSYPSPQVGEKKMRPPRPGPGVEAKVAAATSLHGRYDAEISDRDNAHAVTAGLRMSW